MNFPDFVNRVHKLRRVPDESAMLIGSECGLVQLLHNIAYTSCECGLVHSVHIFKPFRSGSSVARALDQRGKMRHGKRVSSITPV